MQSVFLIKALGNPLDTKGSKNAIKTKVIPNRPNSAGVSNLAMIMPKMNAIPFVEMFSIKLQLNPDTV